MRKFHAAAATLLALPLAACSAEATEQDSTGPVTELKIALPPLSDDPGEVPPDEVLAQKITEKTGIPTEVTSVPDYLAAVESVRGGHSDIGFLSAFPSALAVNAGGVDPMLAWQGNGDPVSTCLVHADSDIQTVADLRGKKVAFADPASSSGFFMPVYMLHQEGLERDRDYEFIFSGGHDAGWLALKNNDVDASCTAIAILPYVYKSGVFEEGQLRQVGESPAIDIASSVIARSDLDAETERVLKQAIPEVFAEGGDELGMMSEFAQGELNTDPTPADFSQLAEIAKVAGVDLEDLK